MSKIINLSDNKLIIRKVSKKNVIIEEPIIKESSIPIEKPSYELSPEQQQALELFKRGENLFITGAGGTGKTHLINTITDYANKIGKNIQICALTGCASVLLNNNLSKLSKENNIKASTIHSWSGIKLAKGDPTKIISNVVRNSRAVKNWRSVDILVIDEVSMMSHKIFNVLEQCGRHVRKNGKAFGGIQIVFSGDFYQLGPIPDADCKESGEFCFESPKWFSVFPKANHIQLVKNFRQNETTYIDILSQIRMGEISDENIKILEKYVKRDYNPEEHNNCVLTKIFPMRNRVVHINEMMFNKLETPEFCYPLKKKTACTIYIDSGKPIDIPTLCKCESLTSLDIDMEVQQLINNSNLIQDLKLKVGAAVMCTVNLDIDLGICNGSQGIIIEISETTKIPKVRFSNGVVMTIDMYWLQSDEYPVIAIGQFPLCLCWAVTIHKIQGASLDMGQVDIGQSIFEYGQSYVALSRIRTLEGLYLSSFNPYRIKANPKVKEFYDLLSNTNFVGGGSSNVILSTKTEPLPELMEESYI